MKQRIEAKTTAQSNNMPHQIYIVKQTNVCGDYNGSRGERKSNEKCGASLAVLGTVNTVTETATLLAKKIQAA